MTSKRNSIRASFAETPSTPNNYNSCSVSCNISFKTKLATTVDRTLQHLSQVWEEAGYEEEEKQNLLGCFLSKMQQMCADELKAEEKILEHAKIQLTSDFAQYCKYCIQLGREQPASESCLGANISDRLAELERRTELIAHEVLERANILNAAVDEVFSLADALGEIRPDAGEYSGPEGTPELADVRVSLLGQIKSRLSAVKSTRQEQMQGLVNQCIKHVNDMSITSLAELQAVPLSNSSNGNMIDTEGESDEAGVGTGVGAGAGAALMDDALVKLAAAGNATVSVAAITAVYSGIHQRDLERLQLRVMSLESEKTRRKTSLAATGVEIARLWTLLRIPTAEREAFQNSFKMNLSSHTLEAGTTELARLRELRKASFAAVIGGMRTDILGLWRECDGCSANIIATEGHEEEEAAAETNRAVLVAHQEDFPQYFIPVEQLDDTAIEQHEAFCNGLKSYVETVYRPLLTKVSRRESIVADRAALEILQQDPSRLTARGPSAREDRKREEVMTVRVRGLDKLTKDLRSSILAWEDAQEKQFFYCGARYLDTMAAQEELYTSTRDNARSARKRKDSTTGSSNTTSGAGGGLSASGSASTSSSGPATKTMRKATPGATTAGSASSKSMVVPLSAKNLGQHINNENQRNGSRESSASNGSAEHNKLGGRMSTMSSDTMCSSATEVRDRASTCTVSLQPHVDDYRTF